MKDALNMKQRILIAAGVLLVSFGCTDRDEAATTDLHQEFIQVPLTEIRPEGWLEEIMELQANGLTGNIEAAGYPFNTGMWTTRIQLDESTQKERDGSFERDGAVGAEEDKGVFWWPYEQTGYYIDGALKCGYLSGDDELVAKSRHQVQYLLKNQQPDGRLGTTKMIGRWFNWPYAGLFRAFMSEYEVTGDIRIIEAMREHYHTFTAEDFQDELDVCNVEELCWLFQHTGDSALLKMAEEAYDLNRTKRENRNRDGRYIDFVSDRIPDYHGVVYFEIVKIPAMLYRVTGNEAYLEEALHGIQKMEEHFMLASGVPSTTEHFHEINERAGHESCNLATLPYTYGTMMQVTGRADWGDKIEKAVFNAGLGAITNDFTAHQYFSAPNQMISTTQTQHFGYYPSNMAYAPGHTVACCTGNINRFIPYYVMQMWMKTGNNGIAATLMGPSELSTHLGSREVPVTITQETRYPFDEQIVFIVRPEKGVTFDFMIRIPAWCDNPEVRVNGKTSDANPVPGTFFSIERKWQKGDRVEVFLPMHIRTRVWPNNGISVERGPIVFSYPVPDSTVIAQNYEKSTGAFPAYDIFPAGPWEFGLDISDPAAIEVDLSMNDSYPWTIDAVPVRLKLPARRVLNWSLEPVGEGESEDARFHVPYFPDEPVFSGEQQAIELVPYGVTQLRVTVFPDLGES